MLRSLNALGACALLAFAAHAYAHQGPDPLTHWVFNPRTVSDARCTARLGPILALSSSARVAADPIGHALDLAGDESVAAMSEPLRDRSEWLPAESLTVSAWVSIDEAESRGGVVGVYGSRGEGECAFRLGYDDNVFVVELNTDRGGRSLVRGVTPYEKGKWSHVAAVYDGESAVLYVNGRRDGAADKPRGAIVYPTSPRYLLGGVDDPKASPMRGRLREASVYDLAAREKWVRHEFDHASRLVNLPKDSRADSLAMVVEPYLQFGTRDGMTVMWQTSASGSSVVHYGETAECDRSLAGEESVIHEVRIEGLKPETQYFYRVETVGGEGQRIESGVSTFSTAVNESTPFAFAVISDTQGNPIVNAKLCRHAWAQRPSFLLHPGDLVSTGVNDTHWTQHFFPGMRELISRVPMYSVLGNHEQNASNYYEYVSLPSPEYYYEFRYGGAHFFMIDTNRNVGPESEQYEWLDKALGESDARWKFACHHHPPYSSDENDYGDLWSTNKSARGDLRARQLSELYDKHNVDLVWNGHIHSYERTWPVREGKAVAEGGGPVYMIVGGGGGGLETPGPYRPFFQNQVRRGHHYVMAHINGPTLEIRSYDLEDRLFDTVTLRKKSD